MTIVGFLLLLLVGAICGAVAEMLVGFSPGGFLASIVIGFLGAWLGTWIARVTHLPSLFAVNIEGVTIEIVWAIIGAMVLLLFISLIRRATYRRPYGW
jgi:uncharacterized membrane protein YeaQ/YmgE (transglycosylase-associated protein family)